jgi:glycosyltransferase involved in cell wall biosynthesis
MKIAIVVGFQWHAMELGKSFSKLGHEVYYITTLDFASPGKRIRMSWVLSLAERIQLLKILACPFFSYLACRKSSNCDLIIVWSTYGAFFNHTKLGKPVIVVRGSHHIDTQLELLKMTWTIKGLVSRFLELRDYGNAYKITVPTEEIANDPKWKMFRNKLVVSEYGFEVLKRPHSLPNSSRIELLYVGILSYRKGLDRLKKIFQVDNPNLMLTLIGRLEYRGFKIPNGWNYLGELPKNEVSDLMYSKDILILLSREEGMARVGLEAIARGMPVIATPRSGLNRWLAMGAGIVTSEDPLSDEVLMAIDEISKSYKRFSKNAIKVSKSWSWEDHAVKLLEPIKLT